MLFVDASSPVIFLPLLLLLTLGYLIIMIVPIASTFVIVLLALIQGTLAAAAAEIEDKVWG
jgi:hypothetical protein